MSHERRVRSARRVVPLAPDHLAALPVVASCAGWQVDPVRRRVLSAEARRGVKADWIREVELDWGSCGRTVLVSGEPVAIAVYAPAAWLPGAAGLPTAPVSRDAVVLAGLYVTPARRQEGLARMLLQGVVADLVRRHGRGADRAPLALEVFGDTRGGHECGTGDLCLLPVEAWERLGFAPHRSHPTTPRLRMNLRTTVGWRGATGEAWSRLAQAVRPAVRPGHATPEAPRATGPVLLRSGPRAP